MPLPKLLQASRDVGVTCLHLSVPFFLSHKMPENEIETTWSEETHGQCIYIRHLVFRT